MDERVRTWGKGPKTEQRLKWKVQCEWTEVGRGYKRKGAWAMDLRKIREDERKGRVGMDLEGNKRKE